MPGEFELIARYFQRDLSGAPGVLLGPGDDCALLAAGDGMQLAISVDTSVAGVHFPPDAPASSIGHRALAVNLSDLAAMGATPRWALLALTLPEVDEDWLHGFAAGFHALAERHGIALVGGDVTRGPLSITITVHGELPLVLEDAVHPDSVSRPILRRDGAREGDLVVITGAPGMAHAGLKVWQSGTRDVLDPCLAAYLRPEPRVEAGLALRQLASAGLDVSDGVMGDLAHICRASQLSAALELGELPLAPELMAALGEQGAREAVLNGGDDYELLLTMPEEHLESAINALRPLNLSLSVIGRMQAVEGSEPRVILEQEGVEQAAAGRSWQHFPPADATEVSS
jgi:thiamine-monophosphate kinase